MDHQESTMNAGPDDDATASTAAPEEEDSFPAAIYDKSQSLVDIANNTFRELCKSLENEQTKLLELEEKRKQLQDEMQRLKAEIEEEKNFYHLNLTQSVSDNLKILNNASGNTQEIDEIRDHETEESLNLQHLDTCYEEDNSCLTTARNLTNSFTIEEHTNHIKKKLQTVLDQCIEEQSISAETESNSQTELKSTQD